MINLFFYQHENIYILTINVELWDLNPLVREFPVRTARSLAAYHSSSAPCHAAAAPLHRLLLFSRTEEARHTK